MVAMTVVAVPAQRVKKTVTQPDGTQLTVVLNGDEFASYYTLTDGTPLKHTLNGRWEPMTEGEFSALCVRRAQRRAEVEADRVAGRRRVGSSTKPQGNVPVLVLLAEYPDCKFQSGSKAALEKSLNEKEYRSGTGYGSAADYFREQSDGQFTPSFEIYGPYQVSHEMAFYGAPQGESNDKNPGELIRETCQLADKDVDFSRFDLDGNGYVDFCYVIYAGYAEAHGADANTIWPHQWSLAAALGSSFSADGVKVSQYACSSELVGISGTAIDGIGTLCHEFSHTLGLPDFYDVDYNGHFGLFSWSLMDYGCYNDNGYTPCGYTAYEKDFMGWKDLVVIDEEQQLTLTPTDKGGVGYKIVSEENPDEYIVIENIQQEGFNRNAYAHGMLALHVDYKRMAWNGNYVNTEDVQRMTIFPADNDLGRSWKSARGDLYPGDGNTELSDYSSPATLTNLGFYFGKPLTDITEADGVVSAYFMKGSDMKTSTLDAVDVTPYSFTAKWQKKVNIDHYAVEVCRIDNAPESSAEWTPSLFASNAVKVQESTCNGTMMKVTNLEANQLYAYRVRCVGDGIVSGFSNITFVKTTDKSVSISAPAIKDFSIADGSFTVSWEPVQGAAAYVAEVTSTPLEETVAVPDESVMLSETFDKVEKDCGEITRVLDMYTDVPNWRGTNIFGDMNKVVIGKEDERGYLLTPYFNHYNGPVTIEFSVGMVSQSDGSPVIYVYLGTDADEQYYVDGIGAYVPSDGANYYCVLESLDTNPYIAFISGAASGDTTTKPRYVLDKLKFFWGDMSSYYGLSGAQRLEPVLSPSAKASVARAKVATPRRISANPAKYYMVEDPFVKIDNPAAGNYSVRVRSVSESEVYSPFSVPISAIYGEDTYVVDGIAYQYYSKTEGQAMVAPFRNGYYSGNVVIPETVTIEGETYSVMAINDSTFRGSQDLLSVTVPSSVLLVGERIFKGCKNLGWVKWNAACDIPAESFIGSDNTFVFVNGKTVVEDNDIVTVVRDGVADEATCYVNCPFLIPEPFTAKTITYTKDFSQKTIYGTASGWETLTLPFDCESIEWVSEDGKSTQPLTPFGLDGAHHFWLATFNGSEFEYATTIKAGVPYIMALPNNAEYGDACLTGSIRFSAQSAKVIATTDVKPVTGSSMSFEPVFFKQQKQAGMYALNSYDDSNAKAPAGSTFFNGRMSQRTFGAVLRANTSAASAPAEYAIRFRGETMPVRTLEQPSVTYHEGTPAIVAYGDMTVSVFAADGRLVRTLSVAEGITPVEDLEKGVYIILNQKVIVK